MREHRIRSGEVTLRAREYGERRAPHVVLVHGYPDDQRLWDGLVPLLPGAHVVTYDVRGMGRSGAPSSTAGYRLDRLREDLIAVLDALVPPTDPVHLVGHDWGSTQLWHCVASGADERLIGRVASFVSASGPSLDHLGVALRRRSGAAVSPAARARRRATMLRQARRSAYLAAFQLPVLPELLWSRDHALCRRTLAAMAAQGGVDRWTPELARSATNGLGLYRANLVPRILRPRPPHVDVPVLLVVARRDAFVPARSLEGLGEFCSDLSRVEINAPHWHPRARPELMAQALRAHLAR